MTISNAPTLCGGIDLFFIGEPGHEKEIEMLAGFINELGKSDNVNFEVNRLWYPTYCMTWLYDAPEPIDAAGVLHQLDGLEQMALRVLDAMSARVPAARGLEFSAVELYLNKATDIAKDIEERVQSATGNQAFRISRENMRRGYQERAN